MNFSLINTSVTCSIGFHMELGPRLGQAQRPPLSVHVGICECG